MPLNPFASMRFSSVFDQVDPEDPYNRKRFFSGIFPLSNQSPPEAPAATAQEPSGQSEGSRYFDELETIRKKRGPALTAYQQHLDTMPTREQTKPSLGRKIAAAVAGGAEGLQKGFGAGVNQARTLVDAPYERALGEWSNKGKSLAASAGLEREEVEDQLKALSEARALGLKYDEYRLKKLEADRKDELDRGNLEVRQRIADLTAARDRAVDARERRRIDAEIDRARQQLDINRYSATTGRINAGTQSRNVDSMIEDRTEGRVIDRERIAASIGNSIRSATGKMPDPNDQFYAFDNALQLLKTDKRFGRFIQPDKSGKDSVIQDDGSPDYQEFLRRLRLASQQSLTKGSFLDTDFGDEQQDDDLIIEPEQR